MRILAIHDGHNATACYLSDGEIVSMVSEERFSNKKNQGGFPERSMSWILERHSLVMDDFDFIAFPHLVSPVDYSKGYGHSCRHRWFDILSAFLPRLILGSKRLVPVYNRVFSIPRSRRLRSYSAQFAFDASKVCQVEHHTAHGYAALYGSSFPRDNEAVLIFTLDDSGDGVSGRVARWDKKKGYQKINESSTFHSLGNLYAAVTHLLGMKPGEDEYKIMGLAPYVSLERSEECFKRFLEYISIGCDGSMINRTYYGTKLLSTIKRDFGRVRFDTLCAGIQRMFEVVVVNWIRLWAQRTGLRRAVFGGGCFMNVKTNMHISELEELEDVFFCPSCGDESTALGAAYRIAEMEGQENICPLLSLYTGPSFSDAAVREDLRKYDHLLVWQEVSDIERKVSELIMNGEIVARFKGPGEWGARALGNRSILSRADDLEVTHRLNKVVKSRDFWMPFAPSILEERADLYIQRQKGMSGQFMMVACKTTTRFRKELIAAMHPYDQTCRPQIVSKKTNPSYHKLLCEYEEMTGCGGILNTSFNLHGFPIVGTPETAIRTFLNSGLEHLAIEKFLVQRRSRAGVNSMLVG